MSRRGGNVGKKTINCFRVDKQRCKLRRKENSMLYAHPEGSK